MYLHPRAVKVRMNLEIVSLFKLEADLGLCENDVTQTALLSLKDILRTRSYFSV